MVEVSNKNLALASIGIGVVGVLASISTGGSMFSLIGGALAGLGAVGAAVFIKMGYLVVPMITQKTKTVVLMDTGYEIPPSQDVILKKAQSGVYYASAFLGMKIYQSALEKEEAEMITYNKQFEMAMTQFKKVVKISYAMHAVDITNDRKKLETQKAEAQLRLQKEREKSEPDVLRINQFERQIAYFEGMINQLGKGLRPMKVVLYAMVTDIGITKDEATAKVKNAADKLGTLLSNSFNCETDLLTGDEMLKAFEWEKFLPTTIEELEDQTESEKTGSM
jgi:hypothetical protein